MPATPRLAPHCSTHPDFVVPVCLSGGAVLEAAWERAKPIILQHQHSPPQQVDALFKLWQACRVTPVDYEWLALQVCMQHVKKEKQQPRCIGLHLCSPCSRRTAHPSTSPL